MSFDLYFLKLVNGTWFSPALDPFFRLVSNWEKLQLYALGILAVTMYFLSARWRYVLLLGAFSILFADMLANDLKLTTNRPRPFVTQDIRKAENYRYGGQSSSMPSNHAANLFAAGFVPAWFLFRRNKNRWLALLPLIPAFLVGYSRVYLGVHYPTDVLAGYAMGALAAGIVLTLNRYIPACSFDENERFGAFYIKGFAALMLSLATVFGLSLLVKNLFPLVRPTPVAKQKKTPD